jgi:hypothetical protein
MATPFLSAELGLPRTAGKPSGGLRNGGFIARTFASRCRAPMGQRSATGEVRHRLRLVVPTDGEAYGSQRKPDESSAVPLPVKAGTTASIYSYRNYTQRPA